MSLSTLLIERLTERNADTGFSALLAPIVGKTIRVVETATGGNAAVNAPVDAAINAATAPAPVSLILAIVTDGTTHTISTTIEAAQPAPADVTVSATPEAWQRVLAGDLVWPHATNATLGVLRVTGDPVVHAWATPALTALFAPAPALTRSELSAAKLPADAAEAGVTGHYVTVDGVQAYYETVGEGPALLVLHTAGRDGRQWHPAMRELAGTHRVYATDLPGHGKSWPRPGSEPCLTDITAIAEWLLAFMTAVGEDRFLVAGTSVGGNLSLLLPALSDRVRGVVAFQGADHTPTVSGMALQLMRDPRVALAFSSRDQALTLIGAGAVPEAAPLIAWSIDEVSAPAQRGDLTAYSGTDTRELMGQVRCPVVLVHGDQDWLATRGMVDGAASRLVNADVRVVSLPGIGHYPHVEDPATAVALIRELTATVEMAGR